MKIRVGDKKSFMILPNSNGSEFQYLKEIKTL